MQMDTAMQKGAACESKWGFSLHAQVDLNILAYDVMWRFAEKQLLCGLSVIVDCPLAREELFLKGTSIAPVKALTSLP